MSPSIGTKASELWNDAAAGQRSRFCSSGPVSERSATYQRYGVDRLVLRVEIQPPDPHLAGAGLGAVSTIAAAKAGPFTVHFWAPMSKWLISGASFLDLKRPTDQISIAQYSALTLTGFFFVPYALLVNPINYILASVNIALFVSSAWQLGRKVKADYFSSSTEPGPDSVPETAK